MIKNRVNDIENISINKDLEEKYDNLQNSMKDRVNQMFEQDNQ